MICHLPELEVIQFSAIDGLNIANKVLETRAGHKHYFWFATTATQKRVRASERREEKNVRSRRQN